ncbi:hypothetical protein [Ursidibacter sp. B-7004-1]
MSNTFSGTKNSLSQIIEVSELAAHYKGKKTAVLMLSSLLSLGAANAIATPSTV